MEENIVSFQVAKLAKEKGFNQFYCNTHYNKIDKLIVDTEGYPNGDRWVEYMKYCISAPTQSLLQKWIRETHKIYVTALPSYTDDSDNKKHYFELFYGKTLRLFGDKYSYFPTYEEALEVGLFEALNLIKNE